MTAALEGSEWSAARPGRTLPPGKDQVPILQEAGWAPGLVWMGGKSRPHRHSGPDEVAEETFRKSRRNIKLASIWHFASTTVFHCGDSLCPSWLYHELSLVIGIVRIWHCSSVKEVLVIRRGPILYMSHLLISGKLRFLPRHDML